MKLWQKIFLPTLALMMLLTALISTLLLKSSRDALWQRESQHVLAQQRYLAGLLRTGVASQRLQRGLMQLDAEETGRAAVQVLGQQDENGYTGGCALYDSAGGALYDTLPPAEDGGPLMANAEQAADKTTVLLQRGAGESWYLLCRMPVSLESGSYQLAAAYEVTGLQRQLTRQAARTMALCLGLSLVGAVLLLLLVRRLLRPLAALDISARRIAAGSYAERLDAAGGDELAGLAADMNQLAEAVQQRIGQLERVAEERKAFIGNLAHEMKTPLTSILGFADLLYLPSRVPDDTRVEYAYVIAEEAKRLRALSGKLLELMTLGSANLIFEPVPLKELTDEVAVSLGPVLAQSGLRLACDCPDTPLWVDRELFKSLLYNLLDNGRKASESGGLLRLAARPEEGQMIILVRDYGRGIPPEELERVCQPFYMVDKSRSRKAGGAGLGLALCQEIVAVHRGKMQIDSRLGQGTLVSLRFPLDAPQTEGAKEADGGAGPAAGAEKPARPRRIRRKAPKGREGGGTDGRSA